MLFLQVLALGQATRVRDWTGFVFGRWSEQKFWRHRSKTTFIQESLDTSELAAEGHKQQETQKKAGNARQGMVREKERLLTNQFRQLVVIDYSCVPL